MAYAVRADIEAKFGLTNVIKWASLDPTDDAAAITARVNSALSRAEDDLNNRLRGGYYVVPFVAPIPSEITDLTATIAGLWLHDSRGVENVDDKGAPVDRLSIHRKDVAERIRKLRLAVMLFAPDSGQAVHKSHPTAGV